MRSIKIIGLTLMLVIGASALITSAASALPEHIFKVEGKKLEAGEKREIRARAKTEFVFKGTGALNIKSETHCKKLKLNAAEKPAIVGGNPGTSEKEKFEFEECTATIGGAKCEKVTVEAALLGNELVTIILPAAKAGKLAWLFTPVKPPIFGKFKFTKCGIFGSQEAIVEGTTAAQCVPESVEVVALTLVWNQNEDITEVERQGGARVKTGLKAGGNPATITGEAEVELVSGQRWGCF